MSIKLFGERIACDPVAEEFEGTILTLESPNQQYFLAEVKAVSEKASGSYAVGDLVYFQTNAMMTFNNSIRVGEEFALVVHPNDVLAKLKSKVIKLENYVTTGRWVLMRAETIKEDSGIILPDSMTAKDQNSSYIRFYVEQKGSDCADLYQVGDEIAPQRGKANPVEISGDRYFYVHEDFIHGVISS